MSEAGVLERGPSAAGPTVVNPTGSLLDRLALLYEYRELFGFLIWREVRARYKQALLGGLWAVLQPLLLMALFTVLGQLLAIESEGVPRVLFYYSAALPWAFFSSAASQGANSLVANGNLLRQIYFPRELFPWSSIGTAAFDFAVGLLVLLVMVPVLDHSISLEILYLPLLVVLQVVFLLPVTLLFAGINVAFRDVKLLIGFILQVWLYASPVIYSLEAVPERYRTLYLLNPMAGLIDSYRRVLVHGTAPHWEGLAIGLGISVLLLAVTYHAFRQAERIFADIV